MSVEIRPIEPDEIDDFRHALADGFAFDSKDEAREHFVEILERERSLAAFDDGQIVGTFGTYSLALTVPGGASVPAAGTSLVAVRPTHRRRGVLTAMMRAHFDDIAARGEPLAALWASESGIYSRFGYGPAAYSREVKINRQRAALLGDAESIGTVRLVTSDEAPPLLAAVYEREARKRPGMLARDAHWWEHMRLYDPEWYRDGASKYRFAIYREGDEPLGYAQYRVKPKWGDEGPEGTVNVTEVVAGTAAAARALWSYLFGIDLMAEIKYWNMPVDDPLVWWLAEPRRLRAEVSDSLWIRLMDVPAALAARRYEAPGRLVIEVTDGFRDDVAGRYLLEGGPDGATCARTDETPDVVIANTDLGAAYLGGNRLRTLARAGRVAGDEAALRRADAMFAWDPLPWCPEIF